MEGSPRVRLEYLDGLRGLAALYVLLGHVFVAIRPSLSPRWSSLLKPLDFGHGAVAVFIVLSGYLLMMPVVRSRDGRLRGGWKLFLQRRARRILPPYFAALGLSLALLDIVPRLAGSVDRSPAAVLGHVFLIHNLSPRFIESINGPMWSVALEWQIYFLLPLVFVPVWRLGGALSLFAVGALLGLLPHLVLLPRFNFDWTYPWYTWLFAMGGVASAINLSSRPRLVWMRERMPWESLAAVLAIISVWLLTFRLRWAFEHLWFTDAFLGLTTAVGLVACTRALLHQSASRDAGLSAAEVPKPSGVRALVLWVISLLESRPVAMLGAFSYSLYLLHQPLLLAVTDLVRPWTHSSEGLVFVHYGLVVPLLLVCCYLFYLVFERPFVSTPGRVARGGSVSTTNPLGDAAALPTVCG